MSKIRLLTSEDHALWHEYLSQLPLEQQDIYFTPEYYKLYEENGDGSARCFVFQQGEDFALYPFLINSINELGYELDKEYYDIQGAYGFNGILSNNSSAEFNESLFTALSEFMKRENIISEFIRINPTMKPNITYSLYFDVVKQNTVFYTDLLSDNIMYDEYEHSTRKNIKKAIRSGVIVKTSEKDSIRNLFDVFYDIYNETMDRNQAESFYYFSKDYFLRLLEYLPHSSKLYVAYVDDFPVSAELVLHDKVRAYSFLGGTRAEFFDVRPNDYLKHTIIEDMKKAGLTYFVLGGGYTDGDGISRYKKAFAKNSGQPFYIGKKVHNQNVYDRIVMQWKEKYPKAAQKFGNILQRYHKLDA